MFISAGYTLIIVDVLCMVFISAAYLQVLWCGLSIEILICALYIEYLIVFDVMRKIFDVMRKIFDVMREILM